MKSLSAILDAELARSLALPVSFAQLRRLESRWQTTAPPPFAQHCRPVCVLDGRLLLQVDSPAWAGRIRHQKQAILQHLRRQHADWAALQDIQVRVVPADQPPAQPHPRPALSAATARLLEQTADAVTDPDLRAALRRLTRHARTPG